MFELRDYQSEAVESAIKNYQFKKTLLVLPTGAGKSLIIAELCRILKKEQIMIITPRIKLLKQNSKYIDGCGILSASLGNDTGDKHSVIIGTYQTLIKRKFVEPSLIIVDEAHLVPEDDSEFAQLLEENKQAKLIGLTATPFRKNQRIYEGSKGRWFKSYEIGLIDLIKKGYLIPPRSFRTCASLEGSSDDDKTKSVYKAVIPVAVDKLLELKRKKTLVFANDIENAEFASQIICNLGYKSYCVHSGMNQKEHEKIYSDFESRESDAPVFLTNVSMLTTGVDFPFVDSIVILRKIDSFSLYVQIVGRGLRLHKNKNFCAVLDYGKNTRLGYLDDPIFAGMNALGSKEGVTPVKSCHNCDLEMPIHVPICENCGFEFEIKQSLNINSTSKSLLSTNVQKDILVDINVTQKRGSNYIHKYILSNGDFILRLFNNNYLDREIKNIGKHVLYKHEKNKNEFIQYF